jgi:hypothetical protein
MPLLYGDTTTTAASWVCPMHPEVISDEPGTCPQCGMKLVPGTPGALSAGGAHPQDHAAMRTATMRPTDSSGKT